MRPSVQKSLLLAVGLAVGASALDGAGGGGLAARPGATLPRLPAVGPGVSAPRLILLPAVAAGARDAPPAAVAPTGGGSAARDEFVRRARRLVAARLAEERCCRW